MGKITLDWNEYVAAARETIAEGMVLLENNGALPLKKDENLAVFGRIQEHYYKSGTGSGGMVNVDKVWNITEGLTECGIRLNEELRGIYAQWEKENPFDPGVGWGGEPWSQKEMPVSEELVKKIAQTSDAALCIIGRTAGEEQDATDSEGSYRLTETELDMLRKVRAEFGKMTVLLNVGGIIDMSFVKSIKPDAVIYGWQGGMIGGLGTADVLTGRICPSGKLSDTIAGNVTDYPSAKWFGNTEREFYCEDIYVGYRYFETFAKDKVLYPFGYGLSYTRFKLKTSAKADSAAVSLEVTVKNIGECDGKEVVQIYFQAPQGKLGNPLRRLCAYKKTKNLTVGEEQTLRFSIPLDELASYDDSGAAGSKSCYIREKGAFTFYVGTDVRSAEEVYSFVQTDTVVVNKLSEACAPVLPFERIKPEPDGDSYKVVMESVPTATVDMDKRRAENLPEEIPYSGDKGLKLADVADETERFCAAVKAHSRGSVVAAARRDTESRQVIRNSAESGCRSRGDPLAAHTLAAYYARKVVIGKLRNKFFHSL